MTATLLVDEHPAELLAISQLHPNSIRIVPSADELRTFTCDLFALHLVGDADYVRIAFMYDDICDHGRLPQWLLDGDHLEEVEPDDAEGGDLIFYCEDGRFRHVGLLMADGLVTSKWGLGHLCQHRAEEVPSSYGTEQRIFRGVSHDDALAVFKDYAREQGVPEEDIDRAPP